MSNHLLTYEIAEKIAGALERLHVLQQNKIVSTEIAAEIRGQQQFLADETPKYINELLGCWFTIRREYEPLLTILATMSKRVQGILSVKPPQS